jgi:Holliday junction resolvasome, DNA-binding subunit
MDTDVEKFQTLLSRFEKQVGLLETLLKPTETLQNNTARMEAETALISLGFKKKDVVAVLEKLTREQGLTTVEELIKGSLKELR